MKVSFEVVEEKEYGAFRKDVKEIFSIAVIEEFGESDDEEEVISDEEINESLYKENAEIYYAYVDGKKVGGVVLEIDNITHHNSVDLLYVYPDCHSKGMGYSIWKAVEEKYPETKVWELVTPYFEKRNINFYVNKCGFKIVEFFNKYHEDEELTDLCDEYSKDSYGGFKEEFFRFEKIMK